MEKLRREANEIEIAGMQDEMADLQEKLARKAKIAEKEIERTKVSSSWGSSPQIISPVGTTDNNLTKVSRWMDKTEEAENEAPSINVPAGYQQTSVSAPNITVQSTHGGQCSTQVRELELSLKQSISTEAANRGSGNDRIKTVMAAGNQRATAQPEVKFAPSKPSMTLMAGQS